jgi:signal transduction histidine kinase
VRRDGEAFVARVRAIPVTWEGEQAILAFAQDRTELRAYEDRLAMADRLASVGTLAAGIAHDLNNPLSHIVLALDLALQTAREGPIGAHGAAEMARLLDGALAGAERLRAIVDDLRVFAHQPHTPPAPVRVGEPLRAALDLARVQLRHRCRLVLDIEDVPEVQAIEGQLSQIFLNVIVNGIQAMPEDRSIEDNVLRIWCGTRADRWARVEIEDNGVGIRPEHLHRVFEPYFTTKPTGIGTGLGLWMVHGVVERLGGEVHLDSTLGKGTKVTIDLPPTR